MNPIPYPMCPTEERSDIKWAKAVKEKFEPMSEQGHVILYFLAIGFGVISIYYMARTLLAVSNREGLGSSFRFSKLQRHNFITIYSFSLVLCAIWMWFIEKYFFSGFCLTFYLMTLILPLIPAYIHKVLARD